MAHTTTEKLLEIAFSTWFMPKLYKENSRELNLIESRRLLELLESKM
jgi:hypothetical protein